MAISLATADPVPTLTTHWGQAVQAARHRVDQLADTLRELELVEQRLAEHGITLNADLGPVGNAAKAARQTVQEHKADHQTQVFTLPR